MYAADNVLPSALHAVLVKSAVAHGTISSIDTRSAELVPGVVAVYSHENAREELFGRELPDLSQLTLDAFFPLKNADIYFAGQVVAVVVARTILAAKEATAKVVVTYDARPVSLALDAPEWELPSFFFGEEMQVEIGCPPEVVDAPHTISEQYYTPTEHHHPMEASATVADWKNDSLTLYDSTQAVLGTQRYVAAALDVPPNLVQVMSPFVGGGFGCKNQIWPHEALAAFISRHLETPVRLILSRADMATGCGFRSETVQDITLKADDQGRLKAISHISTIPTSVFGQFFEPCGLNTLTMYRTKALEVRHRVIRQHISAPTVFRGPGETPGMFALECAMDELAYQLRMDPLLLRLKNYAERDSYHDTDWSSKNLDECYRLGAEKFRWPGHYVEPRSMREGHDLIGYGLATTAYPAVALPATVRVEATLDGDIHVDTAGHDIGQGLYTVLAQVVADELHVPVSAVRVTLGNSHSPVAPSAGRSKSTASIAPAARRAAASLREQLLQLVSERRKTGLTGDTPHHSHGSSDAASLGDLWSARPDQLLQYVGLQRLSCERTNLPLGRKHELSFYSFGAHFVEVRIDEALGRLRIKRVVSVIDCGRILNLKTATSQIKGAIVFGIGMALMEQTLYDHETARVLNDNLADYHIPVNFDIPPIDVLFINEPDLDFNELGARGLGEIGLPGMAAAIANAVFCATGKRLRSLPITPSDLVAGDTANMFT